MASSGTTFDSMNMHTPQRPKHKRNKSSVLKALVSPIGHKRNTSENKFYDKNDGIGAQRQENAPRMMIPPLQRYNSDDLFMRPMILNSQSHMMLSSDKNAGNISKPTNAAVYAKGGAGYDRGGELFQEWKSGKGGVVRDKENSTPPSSATVPETAQSPIFSHLTSAKLMEIPAPLTSDINRRALKAGSGNAGKPSLSESRNGDQYQARHGNTGAPIRRPLSVASAQTIQCPAKSDSVANQSPTRLFRDVKLPNQEAKEDLDSDAVDRAFEEVLVCSHAKMTMKKF